METAIMISDRVLGRKEIEGFLPHRGRMLLLDGVEITAEKVVGKLTVTKEHCEGHAVLTGEEILRGSDLLDMAAQLLSVFLASQYPQFLGRICVVREYNGASFEKAIRPGEEIVIEVAVIDVEIREKHLISITGKNFIVWDGQKEKIKAEINGVKLVII